MLSKKEIHKMKQYIGHDSQVYGVEEHRLVGGKGDGFLKSFTAGFLTTCGLEGAGAPSVDEGEAVPMHGTISNTPAERVYWEETKDL